jgi:hypothetical protein
MALEHQIKEWVMADNQMKLYQGKIRELRETRSILGDNILMFAEEHNLENATILISDGKLRFQTVKTTPPLTFKFIRLCLDDCLTDNKAVEQIINYIKKKREVQYKKDIKRFYTKTN